jgi:hypothetical protein
MPIRPVIIISKIDLTGYENYRETRSINCNVHEDTYLIYYGVLCILYHEVHLLENMIAETGTV